MPYSYENYNDKSTTYTNLRQAIGLKQQLAHFQSQETPLNEQVLLDAGCGTGNYLVEYAKSFKSIKAMDFNEGMLSETHKLLDSVRSNNPNADDRQKINACDIKISQGSVTDLSDVPDESVNCVCNNQVIHHLRGENDFQDLKNTAAGFFRVLKPGGKLVINWTPADIMRKGGMFWAELVPEAVNSWEPRSPSEAKLTEILMAAGFKDVRVEPLKGKTEILYCPDVYLNPRSFIDFQNFRRTDSTLSLVTDEDAEKAVEKMKKMDAEGTLEAWFEKKEQQRMACGQTLNIYATK